jgi:hypothetical protein
MTKKELIMRNEAEARVARARKAVEAAQHCDDPEQHRREMVVAQAELQAAERDLATYPKVPEPSKGTAVVPMPAAQPLIEMSRRAARMDAVTAIVAATAQAIQGRRYIKVEGWQAIALAHDCVASAGDVEAVPGGVRAIGKVIRADTGTVLATAEGFVGDDEQMWSKRPMFARRAMAQTRAISRACRSAFAHVVVLINSENHTDYATTPAEEMSGDVVQGEVISEEKESQWAAEIDEVCAAYGANSAKVWEWLGAQSYDRFNVNEKVCNSVGDKLRKKQQKEAVA